MVMERVRTNLLDEAAEVPIDHAALYDTARLELLDQFQGVGQSGILTMLLLTPFASISSLLRSFDSTFRVSATFDLISLGINNCDACRSRDAIHFCEPSSRRCRDWCRLDAQESTSTAISEQYKRTSFASEPWTPRETVEARNIGVKNLGPAPSMRVLRWRRVDQFTFSHRKHAAPSRQLAKSRIDEVEQ